MYFLFAAQRKIARQANVVLGKRSQRFKRSEDWLALQRREMVALSVFRFSQGEVRVIAVLKAPLRVLFPTVEINFF